MDNFGTAISVVADRFARGEWLDIPWIGSARSRILNPPAPHLEICFVLCGLYDPLYIGKERVALKQDEVCIHNVHYGNRSVLPETETRVWAIFFDVAGLSEFDAYADGPFFAKRPVGDTARLTRAFQQATLCCRQLGNPHPVYPTTSMAMHAGQAARVAVADRLRLQAALLELLSAVLHESAPEAGTPRLGPTAIAKALDYAAMHYANPDITLDDLAAVANLSIHHFGRLFTHHLGIPPMRYLRQLRTQQAQILLAHSNLRIKEIAFEVGFDDPYYFSRCFRADTGLSPRDFRKQNQ